VASGWPGRTQRMRRMLDAEVNCDGGLRSGTVTWLDGDRVVLLTGRPLTTTSRLEALVALDPADTPVSLVLAVDSVHTGSDNPCGIGALHVCRYSAESPRDRLRIEEALARLHPTTRRRTESAPESAASSGSTVPCTRRAPRIAKPETPPPVDVAPVLFAPGSPPSVMVPFRGWDQVNKTVKTCGSGLRIHLAPVPGLTPDHELAVVVQLPTGITVQLDARIVEATPRALVVEAWSVPPWARTAMRLAG